MTRRLILPLFWRIFLFIWLALLVTFLVSTLVTGALIERERLTIERLEGLRDIAEQAYALREEDRGASWRFLREQGEVLGLHLILVEEEGRGQRLPDSVRERMGSWYHQRPAVIELDDGNRLVAWPRAGREGWMHPRFLRVLELTVGFLLLTLACWWIARLVSRPLRHMESTARQIARGDLSLRVSGRIANRRDEVGLMATAFNAMTERLCDLLERQNQLMRDISHDLRTPLARQRIAIELAADSDADPELMASILRQNERLETMTSQILTLYRSATAGDGLEREPVDLVRTLNHVLGDAADYAEQRRVDCHFEAAESCRQVTVLANLPLLERAFENILQNAIDYTPPGRAVTVSLGREGNTLRCDICDQGPGVAEDVLPHLFEPFYRADQSRSGKGWGLGLAIARNIASAHDGRLDACNRPEGGLQVTLWLPVFTAPETR